MDFIPLAEPAIDEADIAAVSAQLASTFVGPGGKLIEFGERVAQCCHRRYALPVCSGTVALSVAATVMGLQPGDEIILPCYGVLSVINAFASIGLKPVLADVDPDHGCLSVASVEAVINERTRAVCYISFLGNVGESLRSVKSLCNERGLIFIEDAAWSLGRGNNGEVGGSFGDIAITSFSVPKIITTGQGGALLTNSQEAFDTAQRLTDQGGLEWRKKNQIETIGSNYRMSDINAALGLSQLSVIAQRHQHKQQIFDAINAVLDGALVATEDGWYPAQNVVFVEDKYAAIEKIRGVGVAAASPYGVYSKLTPYHHLDTGNLTGGTFWEQHAVFLPFGVGTSSETMHIMAERVATLRLDFIKR